MNENKVEEILKWASDSYGEPGVPLEKTFPTLNVFSDLGEKYDNAIVFGDDECYDGSEFYQWMLCKDNLYKAYYNLIQDEDGDGYLDLDMIDYSKPYDVVEYDF